MNPSQYTKTAHEKTFPMPVSPATQATARCESVGEQAGSDDRPGIRTQDVIITQDTVNFMSQEAEVCESDYGDLDDNEFDELPGNECVEGNSVDQVRRASQTFCQNPSSPPTAALCAGRHRSIPAHLEAGDARNKTNDEDFDIVPASMEAVLLQAEQLTSDNRPHLSDGISIPVPESKASHKRCTLKLGPPQSSGFVGSERFIRPEDRVIVSAGVLV